MKILYIDNNEWVATLFRQIAIQHADLECSSISDSKRAVISVIESTIAPDVIVISCGLKDISCKTLLGFIRKQDQFVCTKIVVVGEYFTVKEQRQYLLYGADQWVQMKFDDQSIRDFIVNDLITIRKISR